MKFLIVSLLSILSTGVLAQDNCSVNFTNAYEIDTGSRNGKYAKFTVSVNNVDRTCLNRLGATTACMMSAFSFAYLPGTKENALEAAKKCQCGGTSPSSATIPPSSISATSSAPIPTAPPTTYPPVDISGHENGKCIILTRK